MARGQEIYHSVCVSDLSFTSKKLVLANFEGCTSLGNNCNCCVFQAVLCGDPGSPGGGFREGNIFSYRLVVKYIDY